MQILKQNNKNELIPRDLLLRQLTMHKTHPFRRYVWFCDQFYVANVSINKQQHLPTSKAVQWREPVYMVYKFILLTTDDTIPHVVTFLAWRREHPYQNICHTTANVLLRSECTSLISDVSVILPCALHYNVCCHNKPGLSSDPCPTSLQNPFKRNDEVPTSHSSSEKHQ